MKSLIISNLSKNFKKTSILNDVNFSLNEGESLGIIGANGVGKTVLVKTIVGLLKKDSGDITSNTIKDLDNEISLQFQDAKMNISLTPNDLLKFTTKLHSDKVKIEEIEKAKEIFGVTKYQNKKLSKLSGGQQQRVNLLLAVIRNTKILILDEFTTGLDVSVVEKILNYIREKQKENNTSLIIISHQAEELRRLTNRIILLRDGEIKKEFKTKDIEKEYKGKFYKFLLEQIGDNNE